MPGEKWWVDDDEEDDSPNVAKPADSPPSGPPNSPIGPIPGQPVAPGPPPPVQPPSYVVPPPPVQPPPSDTPPYGTQQTPAHMPPFGAPAVAEPPVDQPANGGVAGGPDESGARRRKLGWAIGAGILVVVVLGVIIGVVIGGSGDADKREATQRPTKSAPLKDKVDRTERLYALLAQTGWDDPNAGEIPVAENEETRSWLDGEGSGAVGLVDQSEDLWLMGIDSCETVAEALETIGSPEELLAAAAGTPDGPTSDILVNLYSSTIQTLGVCSDAAAFESAVAEFAWHWAVADRRLDELGVTR